MSRQRLTIYDPGEPDQPYSVIERDGGRLRVAAVRPGVKGETERWVREGFVAITGEPPNLEASDVLPGAPDFLARLACEVQRSLKLDSRLEYPDGQVRCAAFAVSTPVCRTGGASSAGRDWTFGNVPLAALAATGTCARRHGS